MSTALARTDNASQALFAADDNPDVFLSRAGKTAQALAKMIVAQKLTTKIQGRDYVRVEGWTALGSMLGVFAVLEWTRRVDHEGDTGWEARVQAVTKDGSVIGAAEASCMRSEKTWANRDDYALRSMCQTRATSKALRQPLGFVMAMSGFEVTPAEEMPPPVVQGTDSAFVTPAAGPRATKAQVKEVEDLVAEAVAGGIAAETISAGMLREYGTSVPAELGKGQADNFVSRLRAKTTDDAA